MKKFMSALCAGSIGLSSMLVPVAPSVAAPMMLQIDVPSNVQTVAFKKRKVIKRPPIVRRAKPTVRRHVVRKGYWHGHRGITNYRPGYRRHSDGFWYPLAAFGLGAVVGGAIASQPAPAPAPVYAGNAHVQWCYDHYRSYRASDNTYQPYVGPRKACISPYY